MKDKKRYRLTYCAKNFGRRVLFVYCKSEDLQGEKESWAMFLEEETGVSWRCEKAEEVDLFYYNIGGEGDAH